MKILTQASLAFALMLSFAGCTTTATVEQLQGGAKANESTTKFNRSNSFYVSQPPDGRYGDEPYDGSGSNVTSMLTLGLTRQGVKVESANKVEEYDQALARAKALGCEILVFPKILHWEDRATEWSGIRDKATISVKFIRVGSEETAASAVIDGKGKWATLGGDKPQDILKAPIAAFVASLF